MAYTPINWDELTPINIANLNKMDNAIDSNDNKLDNIDSNGDGKVDNADNADNAVNVTSTYKGNDIDTDGDGKVDNADNADNAVNANNAAKLDNKSAGNSNGDIPINNGTLNTNLNAQKLGGAERSAFVEDSVAAEGNFTGETSKVIVLDNESSVAHKHYVISALEEEDDTSSVYSMYVGFYHETYPCAYLFYDGATSGGTLDNIDYKLLFRNLDADHTYYYKVLRLE